MPTAVGSSYPNIRGWLHGNRILRREEEKGLEQPENTLPIPDVKSLRIGHHRDRRCQTRRRIRTQYVLKGD
jgi:hypothetical protein